MSEPFESRPTLQALATPGQ
ncbi:hypothetical protein C361_00112 [Cryptococcus neoformans Tu259-1]|uniref:Uncharacterized protein n=1 Tax=Cryptococcus neoformans Tu259-1 TaxID=1230072 RepID=A0A854QMU0_CRYNE|nr:hypothetical protein C344_00142 [Cryptococcus neoformans var. grubii AD1-7a]OXG30778.1 hypothetical protein C361_00112 [Cryptococcus neoformans var. grubii Tu259-1]OXG73920.1 hypothetical protein C352_00129 [Cryptococcus neoformans var. grubii CHC193]OXH40514.1 hypothetical protein J005_00135 [Cryptococcus neoformans var. grubii]